jgi:hypothetical protein
MTNPPDGGDQRGGDPGWGQRPPGEPVPEPGQHGQPAQPYGPPLYGPPGYGPPGYGPPGYGQPQYGQPQYGQPQYGPPRYGPPGHGQPGYGAPAPKRRAGLIAGVLGLGVLVAAVLVVLSLTLGTRVLDRGAVERDVATQFQQHQGVRIDLGCPSAMTLARNARYECRGTTADGEDVTLQITVTDPHRAHYTWSEQR